MPLDPEYPADRIEYILLECCELIIPLQGRAFRPNDESCKFQNSSMSNGRMRISGTELMAHSIFVYIKIWDDIASLTNSSTHSLHWKAIS